MHNDLKERIASKIIEVQAEISNILESNNSETDKYTKVYGYLSDFLCTINENPVERYIPICNLHIYGKNAAIRQTLNFKNIAGTVCIIVKEESEWKSVLLLVSFQRDWSNSRFRFGEGSR